MRTTRLKSTAIIMTSTDAGIQKWSALMAAIDDLNTAINQVAATIKDITLNPKPDYSVNGQSVSWASYLSMLTDQITKLQQAQQSLAGPYQRISRMRP
jgi:hypothetical protein